MDKTHAKSTPDHFTSFRMVLRSESPPDTITLEPGRHSTCRTDYKTSFLTGGHNSFESVSPDAGHNFGRVKQSESVGRSREASSVATGHNFIRGKQAMYARKTLESS